MPDPIQSNTTAMQTILVIDDDESLRDTIGVMIEQEGFRAVLVGDGRAGFDKVVTIKPDLVLVDLRLPGMSGTEICKQLRAASGGAGHHLCDLHPIGCLALPAWRSGGP